MTNKMRSVDELRRILFLQIKTKAAKQQRKHNNNLPLSPKSDERCESVVSMKCKCKRIPITAFIFCASICFLLGNISLTIHLNNTTSSGLSSIDLPHNHGSTKTEEKTISLEQKSYKILFGSDRDSSTTFESREVPRLSSSIQRLMRNLVPRYTKQVQRRREELIQQQERLENRLQQNRISERRQLELSDPLPSVNKTLVAIEDTTPVYPIQMLSWSSETTPNLKGKTHMDASQISRSKWTESNDPKQEGLRNPRYTKAFDRAYAAAKVGSLKSKLSLSYASNIHGDNNDQPNNQTKSLVASVLHPIPIQRIRRTKQQQKTRRASRRTGSRKLEPVVPTEESLASDATFAACLLIKDDNDILSEWIAYHFHTMRMRYLIVAVDPLSSESPESILESWSNYTDLEIILWNDTNFMPNDFLNLNRPPKEYVLTVDDLTNIADSNDENLQDKQVMLEISNHRYRQRIFLNSCMKHVRDVNRTWVMHIDTDEYVVPSKLLRQMNPNYVTVQDMSIPGSVLDLIQQVVDKTGSLVNYPCMSMLRVLFGSQEIPASEMIYNDRSVTDDIFNMGSFETLRWRYHALPSDRSLHGNPKVILDVAAIPSQFFDNPQRPVYSIHRPVPEYCPKNTDLAFTNFRKQPLAVNHYIGSWERYSGRNDKRRSKTVYDKKTDVAKRGRDDRTQTWLMGFVNSVGIDIAKILLKQYQRTIIRDYIETFDNVT